MRNHLVVMIVLVTASWVGQAQEQTSSPSSETKPKTSAAKVRSTSEASSEVPGGTRAAAMPEIATTQPLALPVGTAIRMKLESRISTQTSNPGDAFAGRVTEDVSLNGKTVIPVGAAVAGHVLRADEPRRIRGTPTIDVRPELVTLPSGEKYTMNAVVVDTSRRPETDVNDEGRIKGRGHDGRDLGEIAIGTGAGAGVGAMIGGAHGALIGAAVGTTGTVVHWLTKRKSAELPAGTEIIMELSRPMTMSASGAGK